MTSVQQAKELINIHTKQLAAKTICVKEAHGLLLAEDIYASNDFPPFPQSAMDGYAFKFEGWQNEPLQIIGEMQAGSQLQLRASNKQAIRIFTGAPIPAGTDTVVMQEKVLVENDTLIILDKEITKEKNVRPQGSEMKNGSLALASGTYLSPGAIGFIAGLGISEIKVIPKPRVSIIVTGKELQDPGETLIAGQVYESNSYALTAALSQLDITDIKTCKADDDLNILQEIISQELKSADLLLITGGVSVGDYDFVTKALDLNNAETIFHKVKQKPGKPLLFAKTEDTIIFGLPGNPSSVLTCYYEYVTLAIQKLMARPKPFINSLKLPLSKGYSKNAGLTHFLKAKIINGEIHILNSQESYKMNSYATADCLVVVEEEITEIEKGTLAEAHLLY